MSDNAEIWFGRNDPVEDFVFCHSCNAPSAEYGLLFRSFCARCMKSLAERILADVATLPSTAGGA